MSRRNVPLTVAAKALEKAIRLIQQEAEAATLEALSARDGIVVLRDCDIGTARTHIFGFDHMDWDDSHGYSLGMIRQRFEPESWRGVHCMKWRWRPGQWNVQETRVDSKGRSWVCDLGAHITDDFGDLVPVEGCAQ
jgi:hypothetical protein